jgi:hypothetical protein
MTTGHSTAELVARSAARAGGENISGIRLGEYNLKSVGPNARLVVDDLEARSAS